MPLKKEHDILIKSVYIIVLTWNHVSDTIECLRSVLDLDYPRVNIVVVDNASTDGTIALVEEQFPQVKILKNQKNLGYAEGNNIGCQYALKKGADYVFILNNDTIVHPDCLKYLVEDLETNSHAAAGAPKSFFYNNRDLIYFSGGKIGEDGSTQHIGMKKKDISPNSGSTETEWINGCAILIRANALDRIGGYDPRYFLLFEDVDWSLRARRADYTLRIIFNAIIWHKSSESIGDHKAPQYLYYNTRNRHLWINNNFFGAMRCKLHCIYLSKNLRNLKQAFMILIAYSPYHKAIRQGYIDFLLHRFGQRNYQW